MVVFATPADVAVRVTPTWELTLKCVTLNVAVAFPAGMVTLTGTVAELVLELASLTTTPPVGAIPLSDTVPVTAVEALPFTVVGETETAIRLGELTVSEAWAELDP